MNEKDALYTALEISMDEETADTEALLRDNPSEEFSPEFLASMQKMIWHEREGKISDDPADYLPSRIRTHERTETHEPAGAPGKRLRRTVAAFIAAILILALSVTAIAVTNPGIYYRIKERLGYWDIFPDKDTAAEDIPLLEIKEIYVPDGYSMDEEESTEEYHMTYYSDKEGHFISIYQYLPETSPIYHNTGKETRIEKINGREAFITKHDDSTSIVTDDGNSIILLSGTCSYEELYDIACQITE